MRFPERRFTLRNKFILFTLFVAVFPAFIITSIQYFQSRQLVESIAANQLAGTTRLFSDKLSDVFESIERDARFLVETPSMAGVVKSAILPAPDSGSSGFIMEGWRLGLERLFRSLLVEQELYSQIELIGIADGGREMVRVSRTELGIETASVRQLALKADFPYLRKVDTFGRAGTYIAEVTLDKSPTDGNGKAGPAIQLTLPIHDERNALFGVLVLNADLHSMLRKTLPQLPRGHTVLLTTLEGDFLEYDAQKTETSFHFRTDPDWYEPPFYDVLRETELSESLNNVDDIFSYFVRSNVENMFESVFADVIITAPKDILLSESNDAMSNGLVISGLLALGFAALAAILGAQIAEPLRQLTKMISRRSGNLEYIDMEHKRDDEIGDLTEAFTSLSNRLIERSAFADTIFEGAADGIIAIDQNSEILTVNPAAEKIFGYEASEMRGKCIDMLMPVTVREHHRLLVKGAVISESGRLMAEHRGVQGLHSDGREIPLEVSISYTVADNKKRFVGIVRDVSERRVAEQQKQEMIAALERSNTELDSFAYIASHDLKAPLRVIDNASRWLEEDLEQYLDDDTRESMALLRSRILRMERLLDDLLEHSRIGRVEVNEELVSGSELMENIIGLVAVSHQFKIEVAPEFSTIRIPRMPIQNVLLNLVSNSIKHHDRKSGFIEVSVQDHGDEYEISVADDGPGIPPEFHEKVFGMFQTLKPRDQVEGSGMGLAMVKKSIEVAGGEITLTSKGDRGCCFSFTWPKPDQLFTGVKKAA